MLTPEETEAQAKENEQVVVIPTMASAGNGLELKCGVDADAVIWKRYGTEITDDTRNHQIMVRFLCVCVCVRV